MKTALKLVEKGLVPTPLLRRGIRKLCRERLVELEAEYGPDPEAAMARWLEGMRKGPIALVPEAANEQHYEVPGRFYDIALGERKKYSSAFYPTAATTLDEAEVAMLQLTCERARLQDGQDVLEMGCGWGSLTLFMAERYPNSRIHAVSNSHSQKTEILETAAGRGLGNITITTADMNDFEAEGTYDRVVTVEMFEHMRNWEALLGRVRGWIREDGFFFQHVFAHASRPYAFEVKDESDWMSRYFFTGGMMPSHDMLDQLDIPFELEDRWKVSGTHYARTAEDWLKNLQDRRDEALPILAETYGNDVAEVWFQRWRLFFLACAELFAWDEGNEWFVSHNLLRPVTA